MTRRLVVRQTRLTDKHQLKLWPDWRNHSFLILWARRAHCSQARLAWKLHGTCLSSAPSFQIADSEFDNGVLTVELVHLYDVSGEVGDPLDVDHRQDSRRRSTRRRSHLANRSRRVLL